MKLLTGILGLTILAFVGCQTKVKESNSEQSEIVFNDSLGHTISKKDLQNVTGQINYEIMTNQNIDSKAQALHQEARELGQAGKYDMSITKLEEAIKMRKKENAIDQETTLKPEKKDDATTGSVTGLTTTTAEVQHTDKIPEKTVSSSLNKKQNLEYKIQIGAFKNVPDKKLTDKIQPVTKSETDEKGVTKYYSGSYKKNEEAQSMVNKIREMGFPGAFVVAFLEGKQISLEKAKEIEEN